MKRGPRPDFVRDGHGNVVNGLRVQKTKSKNGQPIERYYAVTPDGRRKYFRNSGEKAAAIFEFHLWRARQARDAVAIPTRQMSLGEFGENPKAFFRREIEVTIHKDGSLDLAELVGSDIWWAVVAEQIRANPKLAAQKSGIEELGYLDRLSPPRPSAELDSILQLYLDDKKPEITPAEWTNSKTWWDEFRQITEGVTVRDLNRDAFRAYRQTILSRCRESDRSPVWVRSRFAKIKTIINHAVGGEMDLSEDDLKILELRSLLKPPSKPTPNPIEIKPGELSAILKLADDWETALILTALNCAYYPIDCQRLQWSMIDLEEGTIRFDRTKAIGRAKGSVPRVAALWTRTVRALKKLENAHEHVFVSSSQRPAHIETMRRHWESLCKRAGITRRLTFANLRDSALTAAAASTDPVVPVQQYHVLAGHVAKGVDDNYIRRNPRFVEFACRAIEKRYFPRKRE